MSEEDQGGAPGQGKNLDDYVTTMARVIRELGIEGAETNPLKKSTIVSSRCKDKAAQALLTFDDNHVAVVNQVWKGNAADLSVYKKVTKDRYKFVEKDYQQYLKVGRVKDEYLVHELEKAGVKVQAKSPKLPNATLTQIERKVAHIEAQSQLGMGCAVAQSWMLQFLTTRIGEIETIIAENSRGNLAERLDLTHLKQVAVLAQDAALDNLDLQARQAAEAKWIRRSVWVDLTRWPASVKTAVKSFATVGDGSICGPALKDQLESYRLTTKALEAAATPAKPVRDRKRTGPQGSNMGPPQKMPRMSRDQSGGWRMQNQNRNAQRITRPFQGQKRDRNFPAKSGNQSSG
jgi:hypothetical protein